MPLIRPEKDAPDAERELRYRQSAGSACDGCSTFAGGLAPAKALAQEKAQRRRKASQGTRLLKVCGEDQS